MSCFSTTRGRVWKPSRIALISYATGALAFSSLAPCRGAIPSFSQSEPEPRGFWNQSKFAQTEVGLEADFTNDANAFGLRIDQPYLINPKTVVIGELHGAKGDQGFGILSGGVAIRRLLTDSGLYVGGSVFYDALQDSDGFSYSQIGLGAEISKGWLTLRGNAYLPVGDGDDVTRERRSSTRRRSGTFTDAAGLMRPSVTTVNWTETTTTRRIAAWAWDAEIEAALPHSPTFFDPRLAVGCYQVHGDHGDFAGVKVRGEVRFGSHVVTELEWRQDSEEIGQEWRGRIRFEFLLGRASPSESASMRTLESYGGGKGVRDLEYKQSKELVPIETYPRGFFDRVKRTAWPQVVRSSERTTRSRNTVRISGVDPTRPPLLPPGVTNPPGDCTGTGTNGGGGGGGGGGGCPTGTN